MSTSSCPVCNTPHNIPLTIIRWVVCSTCQHLLAYEESTLVDHGKTPPMPDVERRFTIGDTGRVRGRWFEILGSLHYGYANSPEGEYWEEWLIRFDNDTVGYIIVEDDDYYFFAYRTRVTTPLPDFSEIEVGKPVIIDGTEGIVYEADTYNIRAIAGLLPDHPLPGSIHNYFDSKAGNYVVNVEYYEEGPVLHYGVPLEKEELIITPIH